MKELVFIKENKAVTDSLTVAEMFGKEHKNVIRDIKIQMEYSGEDFARLNFEHTQYQNEQNKQLYPKFNLTEDAFMLVCMSYNTKEAVQMKIKFIKEFKRIKEQLVNKPMTALEIIAANAAALVEQEKKIKSLESAQREQAKQIQGIRDVVAINVSNWRQESNNVINKIAKLQGSNFQNVRANSYKLLEQRAKCMLSIRLTNLKRVMLENGCSKSKVDKANKLDVIDNDQRLKEIYISIIKEMAIKNGVDVEGVVA